MVDSIDLSAISRWSSAFSVNPRFPCVFEGWGGREGERGREGEGERERGSGEMREGERGEVGKVKERGDDYHITQGKRNKKR